MLLSVGEYMSRDGIAGKIYDFAGKKQGKTQHPQV
jgi:hypothetical protein